MTKVKTLKPHRNIHGIHKDGDVYDHARPDMDIKFGFVEGTEGEADENPKASAKSRPTKADSSESDQKG